MWKEGNFAHDMDITRRRPGVLVLLLGTLVSMATVEGAVELAISVIWDSREITDAGAVMTSLSQISPNYAMNEMSFREDYIDLATLNFIQVKEAVCQHMYSGTVAFLYVYTCEPQAVVEAAILDLPQTTHLRFQRLECDPGEDQSFSNSLGAFFGSDVSDVGRVVMEVVAHSGWEDTVIVYDDSRRDHADSLMYYSEISGSSLEEINIADFASGSIAAMATSDANVTSGNVTSGNVTSGNVTSDNSTSDDNMALLDYLERSFLAPRTTILVLTLEDTVDLLDKMNYYNWVRNVQGVFIYLDQWLVVADPDWLPRLENAIGDVDNVAAVTSGWSMDNQTTIELINDAYANTLETVQLSYCGADNVTAGGALSGECSSPYGHAFTEAVDADLKEAEEVSLCHTCGQFLLHTAWRRSNETRDLAMAAKWLPSGVMALGAEPVDAFPNLKFGYNGRHFIVGTNEWSPFVIVMGNSTIMQPEFTGLCMEMENEMRSALNFTSTRVFPSDMAWGVEIQPGVWNGLVGELHNKTMDFTFAPLSITIYRERVVDFSVAFYQEYTSVLTLMLNPDDSKWRLYISPFRWTVWLLIIASIPFIAFVIYFFQRMSPYYSREQASKGLGQFEHALLYAFGSLFTQGGVFLPDAQSGRFVVGFWWMYCIVVVATYSGNLIAFLTVYETKLPFNTVEEMTAMRDSYEYSTLANTSTVTSLNVTQTPSLQELWATLDVTAMNTLTHEQHMQRVRQGGYAYIADLASFDASLAKYCDLDVTSDRFFPSGYGVALQNNSQYLDAMNKALSKTVESGLINRWKQEFWPRQSFCSRGMVTQAEPVALKDVQGAYYALGILIALATLVLVVETCLHLVQRQRSRRPPETKENGHLPSGGAAPQVDAEEDTKIREDQYKNQYVKTEISNGFLIPLDDIPDLKQPRRNSRVVRRGSIAGPALDIYGRPLEDGVSYDEYGYAIP